MNCFLNTSICKAGPPRQAARHPRLSGHNHQRHITKRCWPHNPVRVDYRQNASTVRHPKLIFEAGETHAAAHPTFEDLHQRAMGPFAPDTNKSRWSNPRL